MKKVIIGLSAVLLVAFAVILAVGAKSNPQETKKSCTEMAKDSLKCHAAASSCCKMKSGSTAETKGCNMTDSKDKAACEAKCKEAKCDHGSGKSETASTTGEAKKSDQDKAKPGSQN